VVGSTGQRNTLFLSKRRGVDNEKQNSNRIYGSPNTFPLTVELGNYKFYLVFYRHSKLSLKL